MILAYLRSYWKPILMVGMATGVITLIYIGVQTIKKGEIDRITIELQDKTTEKRRKINEAISTSPSNVDDSLQYLKSR